MAMRNKKPITAGLRDAILDDFSDITRSKPEKSLCVGLRKSSGRNNAGRITVRHRGGGHKRLYRKIDFKRQRSGVAVVQSIEYDPNRTARIALIRYEDGQKSYIIAPHNLTVNSTVSVGDESPLKAGHVRQLKFMPTGTLIYNVELTPGKGGQIVRSAGTTARVIAHEGKYTLLELPSGERRNILSECAATVGTISNQDHKNRNLGKAGRKRHMGIRPTVRGSAMAPNAHPHGGGEGRAPIGLKHPKTPTGKPALGVRTRRNRASDRLILRRRYERN